MVNANFIQAGFGFSGTDSTSQVTPAAQKAESVKAVKNDFSSYMDGSGNAENDIPADKNVDIKEGSKDTAFPAEDKTVLYPANVKDMPNEPEMEEIPEDMKASVMSEAVLQMVKQVVEVIKDTTGCTDNQLKAALENLGIKPEELLSADTIKNVVMELNSIDDPSVLLVDQESYRMFADIVADVAEITEDFAKMYDLTPEQKSDMPETVKQFLPQEGSDSAVFAETEDETLVKGEDILPAGTNTEEILQTGTEDNVLPQKVMETDKALPSQNEYSEVQDTVLQGDEIAEAGTALENDTYSETETVINKETVPVEEGKETETVINQETASVEEVSEAPKVFEKVVIADGEKPVREQVLKETDVEINKTEDSENYISVTKADSGQENSLYKDSGFSGGSRNGTDFNDSRTGMGRTHISDRHESPNTNFAAITNNLFEHIKEAVSDIHSSDAQNTSFATRIFNQLMDGIKVMSGEDMTSMEMQLYPENLGKLSINVLTKNGVITAQIVAQNEAVKEAIESQVYQLKENLGNQEIRIEDVEVTVSSHAFEQNMDNSSQNDSGQQQKRKRFITDDDDSTLSMSDINAIKEEILEEAIKEQNGSTVSYTA